MKKKIAYIILITLLVCIAIFLWTFEKYKERIVAQPPYFDLFLAEIIFETKNELGIYWGSVHGNVSSDQRRPIKWQLDKSEYEKLDSIYLGFANISNEKFYYVTWGKPNSRMRTNLSIYRNGKIESIPFKGFGCSTGIHLAPINKDETVGKKQLNPLMFNPYTGYPLPLKNEKFPELYRKLYGDSIAISYKQATYSLPWNTTPSQMIASDPIIISTETVIENWEKGLYRLTPAFEKEHELSFYVKADKRIH